MLELLWWCLLLFTAYFLGWTSGYREGREDQKQILVRLRKSIANTKG